MPATASAGCPGYWKCTPASSMAPLIFGSGRTRSRPGRSVGRELCGLERLESRLTGVWSRPEILPQSGRSLLVGVEDLGELLDRREQLGEVEQEGDERSS